MDRAKEINKFLEEATAPKEMTLEEWQELDRAIQGDAETATTTEDCISRQAAIEALTGWDTDPSDEDIVRQLNALPPVTPTEQNEEDVLKFYYVESLDEYWIGQRCGTRYYGKWTGDCFTYGYSRYLPWGEHVVAPDTLWKEHTYPSEPKEIPFNEWLQGFLQKECQTERTGWIPVKYHKITDKERQEQGHPKEWVYFIDSEMPEEGQEILVQTHWGDIRWDVCCDDGLFVALDSGWDWIDDITAWMPLPEPYKGGDTE